MQSSRHHHIHRQTRHIHNQDIGADKLTRDMAEFSLELALFTDSECPFCCYHSTSTAAAAAENPLTTTKTVAASSASRKTHPLMIPNILKIMFGFASNGSMVEYLTVCRLWYSMGAPLIWKTVSFFSQSENFIRFARGFFDLSDGVHESKVWALEKYAIIHDRGLDQLAIILLSEVQSLKLKPKRWRDRENVNALEPSPIMRGFKNLVRSAILNLISGFQMPYTRRKDHLGITTPIFGLYVDDNDENEESNNDSGYSNEESRYFPSPYAFDTGMRQPSCYPPHHRRRIATGGDMSPILSHHLTKFTLYFLHNIGGPIPPSRHPHIGAQNLRSLHLHNLEYVTDELLIHVVRKLPVLVYLSLSECCNVSDASIVAAAVACGGTLRHVATNGCLKVGNVSAAALAKFCYKELESWDARACPKLTDDGVVEVVEKCRALELVNLGRRTVGHILSTPVFGANVGGVFGGGTSGVTDRCLSSIRKCPRLKALSLTGCNVTDKGIESLLKSDDDCNNNFEAGITRLSLNFTLITSLSLELISKHCINLKYLAIKGCTEIENVSRIRDLISKGVEVEMSMDLLIRV